jgi:tRNA-specific 2-thiouridylase
MFPLGKALKSEVRRIAEQHGLSNHAKKDSTGICFIGERPFREFLNRYLPTQPGEMRTPTGEIVGQHQGLSFYTIGQRQGLGIGGAKNASGEPWFVYGKDMANNRLLVVQGHDHPALQAPSLLALDSHWISGTAPELHHPYAAKTRYRQADAPCQLLDLSEKQCTIAFEQPQWAITPGQSVVVYDGNVCLGGAIIERAMATL